MLFNKTKSDVIMKALYLKLALLLILQLFSIFIYGQSTVKIHKDRTVTFQVQALYANSVYIEGRGGAMGGIHDMDLSRDGIWKVTTPPLEPGFHYYQLVIDSVKVNFPGQPTYFGYTPPGYHSDLNLRFPVLFLQHGAGESEMAWVYQGKVNFILDNLICNGLAVPMIVVMDNGYAAKPGAENPKRPAREDNDFEELVLNDLIPLIDRNFRTLKRRRFRAIAGLSMGGGQALQIGFTNPDIFGSIGILSAYPWNFDMQTFYNRQEDFNEQFELIWLGYGEEDRRYKNGLAFHRELESNGIEHIWYECDGGNVWQVWRKHFYDLATHLFK
jgi:enterochelin esterase family protein